MNHSIFLQGITPEQFGELIDEKLKQQIDSLREALQFEKANDQLLTRDEACDFLSIDQSTLWSWTNKGRVRAYGIGARRYYKRSELIEALTPLQKQS